MALPQPPTLCSLNCHCKRSKSLSGPLFHIKNSLCVCQFWVLGIIKCNRQRGGQPIATTVNEVHVSVMSEREEDSHTHMHTCAHERAPTDTHTSRLWQFLSDLCSLTNASERQASIIQSTWFGKMCICMFLCMNSGRMKMVWWGT